MLHLLLACLVFGMPGLLAVLLFGEHHHHRHGHRDDDWCC
jgi:hypothetical protein